MAFEADCGSSTVLEALRVASTPGFLVSGEGRVTRLRHNPAFRSGEGVPA